MRVTTEEQLEEVLGVIFMLLHNVIRLGAELEKRVDGLEDELFHTD